MEKKWYKISFSAEMTEDDKRAMNKCFYDAMEESMQISPCADLKIEEESKLSRKDELFSNMINHISELVSSSDDLKDTLHCIGFTDEEILQYVEIDNEDDCNGECVRKIELKPEFVEVVNKGLNQIKWLNDSEINEKNIDDVLCDLKPFFADTLCAKLMSDNFDEWYDEFCEDHLKEYLLERGIV